MVNCEHRILLSEGFEPTIFAFAASVLTVRPRGHHGIELTTPRLIIKHIESISPL